MRSIPRARDLIVVAGCTLKVDNSGALTDLHGGFIDDARRTVTSALLLLLLRRCSPLLHRRARIWERDSVNVVAAHTLPRQLRTKLFLFARFRHNGAHGHRLRCMPWQVAADAEQLLRNGGEWVSGWHFRLIIADIRCVCGGGRGKRRKVERVLLLLRAEQFFGAVGLKHEVMG